MIIISITILQKFLCELIRSQKIIFQHIFYVLILFLHTPLLTGNTQLHLGISAIFFIFAETNSYVSIPYIHSS